MFITGNIIIHLSLISQREIYLSHFIYNIYHVVTQLTILPCCYSIFKVNIQPAHLFHTISIAIPPVCLISSITFFYPDCQRINTTRTQPSPLYHNSLPSICNRVCFYIIFFKMQNTHKSIRPVLSSHTKN